jgi:hypothetical protein
MGQQRRCGQLAGVVTSPCRLAEWLQPTSALSSRTAASLMAAWPRCDRYGHSVILNQGACAVIGIAELLKDVILDKRISCTKL